MQWCMSGTTTNCGSELGGSNATAPIEACGPVFVEEAGGATLTAASVHSAVIQGALTVVVSLPQVSSLGLEAFFGDKKHSD